MLSLYLLGSPQISLNGTELPESPSGKNLALLAYLALESRSHPREKLAALLWSDQPQARAQSNLRMAVYTLNQLLPGVLTADRTSLGLSADISFEVDLLTLQQAASQPNASLEELQAAIRLWRGPFLDGLGLSGAPLFEEWLTLRLERSRLDLLHLLERLSDLAQQSGQTETAISALRQWLALEPWSEHTHRRLILALARAGRYTEALAQYENCRSTLERELDLEPMPETCQLVEQIKEARALPRRHNLPQPGQVPLIGRARELGQLHQNLLNPGIRLLSLVGLGGIGKSRLALAVGQQLQHAFLHGVFLVPIETDAQTDSLHSTVLAVLQHPIPPGATPEVALQAALRERELLLILDGFEHILSFAPTLKTWLDYSPRLKLLITSRQPLQLRDEVVFPLEGLPVEQAAEMFSACASRLTPRFDPYADPVALREICRLTGGLPLALELAAAWTPRYPLREIASQIRADSEALSGAFQDLPLDQRSLRAIIEFSWNLLAPAAQKVLAALSVFHGSFTSQQSGAVGGASREELSLLVQNNFLQSVADEVFSMHEIVRQFAAGCLAKNPSHQVDARRAHQVLFGSLLNQQNALLTGGESTTHALQTLAEHFDDLRAAWENACRQADSDWLETAAEPLHKFSEGQARYREGQALFAQALASLPPDSSLSRLRSHHAALLLRLGRLPEALAEAELVQAETMPLSMQGFAANLLGILYAASGQPEKAMSAYQRSLDAYQQANEPHQRLKPLANLGPLLVQKGQFQQAHHILQEGLALAREHDDRRGQTHFLNNLGVVCFQQHDYPAAARHYRACAELCQEIGNDGVRLVSLYNLAEIFLFEGKPAEALQPANQAIQLAKAFNDRRNQAHALRILGQAHLDMGLPLQAETVLQESLSIAREIGAPAILLEAAYGWALFLSASGQIDRAAEIFAIVQSHPVSDPHLREQSVHRLAQLEMHPEFTQEESQAKLQLL